jgi:hypothetical protein
MASCCCAAAVTLRDISGRCVASRASASASASLRQHVATELCCAVCGCGSVAVEENREVLVTGHLRASDTPLAAVQLGHSGESDPVRLWQHGVGPFMERKVSLVFGAVGVNEGGCASGHGVPRCSVHFV